MHTHMEIKRLLRRRYGTVDISTIYLLKVNQEKLMVIISVVLRVCVPGGCTGQWDEL
jgi:hypothetical protein